MPPPLPPPPEPAKRRGRRAIHGYVPPVFVPDPEPEPDEGPYLDPDEDVVEAPPDEPDTGLTGREADELMGLLAEIATRKKETLRLFEPMPEQQRFFASDAGERIALGGNRGGKTTVTVVEIARAVTGQDPHDKYPKEDGICILVGKDLTHCSKVFYRKLFKAGCIKIIRDAETGEWRPFRPSSEADLARIHEAKLSPPLIPKRFYDEKRIAWENKKDEIPKTIPLKNGWTIHFFSSLGAPPQGWDVDIVCFDEEITHPLWYPEMAARLLDRRVIDPVSGRPKSGKFLWAATPQAGTQQLYDLKVRADEQLEGLIATMEEGGKPAPTIECFAFGLLDNTFMSAHAKDDLIAKFASSPDEYAVRVLGHFALMGMRVYGEFAPKGVHGIDPFPIPDDWTRYCAVDPGHQICAVLFVAIPPPYHELSGRKIIYDELYIPKCNSKIFAAKLKEKVGDTSIHDWIIDHRAGRITEIGSGKTHEQQYTDALKAVKLSCVRSGYAFQWSSDDVKAGIESVRRGLHIIEGRSEWAIMRDKCPKMTWEAERYSYRRTPTGVVTDEPIALNSHLMDCWRYLAMANLKWSRPKVSKRKLGYTCEALKMKKERAAARGGWDGSIKVG